MEQFVGNCRNSVAFLVFLACFCSDIGIAIDTITSSQFIRDPETIISSSGIFTLGFFSPGNSTNRYVGIWYNNISVPTAVWVANRDKPLIDSSGIFAISENGNLVVSNGPKEILWSSNVLNPVANASAKLLDDGSLVLYDNRSGINVWESFQEPTDTFLPRMKLSTNLRTGKKVQMTSWRSPSDPSNGSFFAGIGPSKIPEVFIWNENGPHWRSGPWNGQIFVGVDGMIAEYFEGYNLGVDSQGTAFFTFSNGDNFFGYFVLNSQGILEQIRQVGENRDPQIGFRAPKTECDVYGRCGPFGSCNSQEQPICSCLRGFEPKIFDEWSRGNWTSGCVRMQPLHCERINQTGDAGNEDGFLKLEMMKVPDFGEQSFADYEDKCRDRCLNNCFCIAYAYDAGISCMTWSGNLIDLQKFSEAGLNLYIRTAKSELDADRKQMNVIIIIVPVVVGIITMAICAFFTWRWMANRKAMKVESKMLPFDKGGTYTKFSTKNVNQDKLQDLPLFNFEELANATNNFDSTNKLGQGGFGPVYKGKLQDGQAIAVKRLSRFSGQGLEEFMNEVIVISGLQHRNLVRLLGCCIEREEEMLVYEYMPNKSLDAFLFDPLKQEVLDWRKRFSIIEGISRGLLYLHRDSRLRIIHRDLKPSNILLDEELSPKISDFGMARIFRGNQDQADTGRVVGTYGYMSPEYAMEGRFSEKSDVFSFGVLLLEIVSGRRNTSFHQDEHCLSLLGYAWKLWNENNVAALIDPVVADPSFKSEILRCIQVGFLCVQEFVKDRPSMSTVTCMLNSEIVDLPAPNQPAFTERLSAIDTESPEQNHKQYTINNLTITVIGGR